MNITKPQLKRIIQEELQNMLNEGPPPDVAAPEKKKEVAPTLDPRLANWNKNAAAAALYYDLNKWKQGGQKGKFKHQPMRALGTPDVQGYERRKKRMGARRAGTIGGEHGYFKTGAGKGSDPSFGGRWHAVDSMPFSNLDTGLSKAQSTQLDQWKKEAGYGQKPRRQKTARRRAPEPIYDDPTAGDEEAARKQSTTRVRSNVASQHLDPERQRGHELLGTPSEYDLKSLSSLGKPGLDESQLKRIIQEELQNMLNEQGYGAQAAKAAKAASPAFQARRDITATTTNGKANVRDTSMYRGKQDITSGAQRKIKSYASRTGEGVQSKDVKPVIPQDVLKSPEEYKGTSTSGFESDSPGAAEKLEFEPWKGSTTTQGTGKEFKETEFIQPATTRYGQLGATRTVTESQLKRIIQEELERDPALLSALERLIGKLDNLDSSIDYLAALMSGVSPAEVELSQTALGRLAGPGVNMVETMNMTESQVKRATQEEFDKLLMEQEGSGKRWKYKTLKSLLWQRPQTQPVRENKQRKKVIKLRC